MKKILSFIVVILATIFLVACGGKTHEVTGKEVTDTQQIELALDKLTNTGGQSAIGDSYGIEANVKMSQTVDGESIGSFEVDGKVFVSLAEKLNDLKLHAELDLTGTMEGMNISGEAGVYVNDSKLYSTGIATSQFKLPAKVELSELGITATEYEDIIESMLNPEGFDDMPEFEIPFELQEIISLLVEHKIVTIFEDGKKLSFVFHLTLEKLEALALELDEEEFDVEAIQTLDVKLTLILVDNTLTFLEVELDLKMDVVVDYEIDDEFNWVEVLGTVEVSGKVTFKNNAKIPAFPSNLEN